MLLFDSLLHTLSIYANRWGGARYRTSELIKFVNKHLYNKQEKQLIEFENVNTCLVSEALLSATHIPFYMSTLRWDYEESDVYEITDELGYKAKFPAGTEILIEENDNMKYLPIERIQAGLRRVINFELVEALKNDKLHHHTKFNEDFFIVNCEDSEETQKVMCDAITAMTIVKESSPLILERLDVYDNKNIQEIYLVDIVKVEKLSRRAQALHFEVEPFSFALTKDRANSNKSNLRYYKSIGSKRSRRYLDKMRSKIFDIKKSKIDFKMDLIHEKNNS